MGERHHRCGVVREDTGYYGVCSCGWRERFHFLLAAQREVKAHRRYPDGNPRIKADVQRCSTCGGRGWHTAGGNDPIACGRCEAGDNG